MYPLEVEHVTKSYRHDVVVDDLTFTVQPGRVTGFLEPVHLTDADVEIEVIECPRVAEVLHQAGNRDRGPCVRPVGRARPRQHLVCHVPSL